MWSDVTGCEVGEEPMVGEGGQEVSSRTRTGELFVLPLNS